MQLSASVAHDRTGNRTLLRLPAAGVLTLAFAAATYARADFDLWGHLRFGLDTLESWSLPAADPYSFTQDTPWINHEWLSELQMALAWRLGGTTGLALLKGVLTMATFLAVWRTLRGVRFAARAAIIAVLAFGSIHMTSSVRPQLWTFLFLSILCSVLVGDSPRARRWLPVLFAAWANHHGGWVVGLGVLWVWAAAEALIARRSLREWTLVVVASTLATLVTPYGWILWEFVLRTVRVERAILEWLPMSTNHWLNWAPWLLVIVAAIWTLRRDTPHRAAIAAVLAMLAYGSLRVFRIESLFILAAAVLLSDAFCRRWPSRSQPLQRAHPAAEWFIAATAFLLPTVAAAGIFASTLRCLPTLADRPADVEAVQWLRTAQRGRLVTYFDWGQYAIWHLAPRLKVSMDGRRETVYSDARIAEHDAIVAGTPVGFQILASWRPEYVWLPVKSVATKQWLGSNGYRIEVDSDRSFVAVRTDLPPLEPPETVGSGQRCFPQ